MFNPIHFSELRNMNDAETIVFTGVIFEETETELKDLNDMLHRVNLLPEGKNVIDYRRILDNVLGSEGRTDYLLVFDAPDKLANPMVRLMIPDLKWTSDFVDNYAADYAA